VLYLTYKTVLEGGGTEEVYKVRPGAPTPSDDRSAPSRALLF
jgi:hypothetical protein